MCVLQEIQILHRSSKSLVRLMMDTKTGRRVIHKELNGIHPVYEKLRMLQHPYLPHIFCVEYQDGKTYVAEEYIEGVSLGYASLSERALTKAFLEVCQVLEFLHGHQILHRDIKPEHILLAADGHIRLIDFDAAREPKADEVQDTRLLGTRGYAPPEQYGFSQTDARADIYALGATFRQLLGPVARRGRWKHILRRCTALDPKDRYAAAGKIQRAVYRGRLFRWVIRPFCILVVALFAALLLSVFITPSSRLAALSVMGMADTQVWQADKIDTAALEKAAAEGNAPLMYQYTGTDALKAYHRLKAQYPDYLIVYSGYMDPNGAMVFGCLETTFLIRYGAYAFDGLHSIVAITPDGIIRDIETDDEYDRYAPAVMAIYEVIEQMPRIEPESR